MTTPITEHIHRFSSSSASELIRPIDTSAYASERYALMVAAAARSSEVRAARRARHEGVGWRVRSWTARQLTAVAAKLA